MSSFLSFSLFFPSLTEHRQGHYSSLRACIMSPNLTSSLFSPLVLNMTVIVTSCTFRPLTCKAPVPVISRLPSSLSLCPSSLTCDASVPVISLVSPPHLPLPFSPGPVGGGTAGSALAGRLSEVPEWRVLLLEAGEAPPVESLVPGFSRVFYFPSKNNWAFDLHPQRHGLLSYSNRVSRRLLSTVARLSYSKHNINQTIVLKTQYLPVCDA